VSSISRTRDEDDYAPVPAVPVNYLGIVGELFICPDHLYKPAPFPHDAADRPFLTSMSFKKDLARRDTSIPKIFPRENAPPKRPMQRGPQQITIYHYSRPVPTSFTQPTGTSPDPATVHSSIEMHIGNFVG
jgi:hypothetical protein